jgi:hypothetical protein
MKATIRNPKRIHYFAPSRLAIVMLLVSSIFTIASRPQCWALQPAPVVSIISLIAAPEKYDRKIVQVTGYVTLGFERNFLFLSPYDSQEFIARNALSLDFGNKVLEPRADLDESEKAKHKQWEALYDHQTVDVKGTFYYPKGVAFWTGYPNGIITNITDIELHDIHRGIGREVPK